MPATLTADSLRICLAAFLRSLGVGMTGVLLAIYLSSVGWNVRTVGMLVTVGLSGDRKSTRLNSSHLVISYAVFCLKKKKSTRYADSAPLQGRMTASRP